MGLLNLRKKPWLPVATAIFLQMNALQASPMLPKSEKRIQSEILYRAKTGDLKKAVQLYQFFCQQTGRNDLNLVQQIAQAILEQGARCREPEDQLLAVYGAGITADPQLIYILENGLNSQHPIIQIISLQFLEEMPDDRAYQLIKKCMNSPQLGIRYEALAWLSEQKDPDAPSQIESLMHRVDSTLHCFFPPMLALCADSHSTALLRQMIHSTEPLVRLATILAIAECRRDDLLSLIKSGAVHGDPAEQEAAAYAFGILKDHSSIRELERLSRNSFSQLRLAALHSLYLLGRLESRASIEKLAMSGDLFAITLLGEMQGANELLFKLAKSSNLQVRANATMALLNLRDPRCLHTIKELLFKDNRDYILTVQASKGQTLKSWKMIPSCTQQLKDEELAKEKSKTVREAILEQTAQLPQEHFLKLAQELITAKQLDLFPKLTGLIEKLGTEESVDFLKAQLGLPGNPLIRNYCNLALYRLKEEGPYGSAVIDWIAREWHGELINFNISENSEKKSVNCSYSLSLAETSRLLVDSLVALATQKDPRAIDALLITIAHGNPKNRFALAGLLMQATY